VAVPPFEVGAVHRARLQATRGLDAQMGCMASGSVRPRTTAMVCNHWARVWPGFHVRKFLVGTGKSATAVCRKMLLPAWAHGPAGLTVPRPLPRHPERQSAEEAMRRERALAASRMAIPPEVLGVGGLLTQRARQTSICRTDKICATGRYRGPLRGQLPMIPIRSMGRAQRDPSSAASARPQATFVQPAIRRSRAR
jgi:hypothetical protein